MPEVHITACLTHAPYGGDTLSFRMPVTLKPGECLVLHIEAPSEPVAHKAVARVTQFGHSPRTGLPH